MKVETGIVRRLVNLGPRWSDFPLKRAVEEALGMPVVIEGNSRATVLAEKISGGGDRCSHLVYINLGEGISAGVMMGGRILRGPQGNAGELGHILIQRDGPLCNCGNRGCLEAVCAIPALVNKAARELSLLEKDDPLKKILTEKGGIDFNDILACAAGQDSYASGLLREMGRLIGVAIAGIINLYSPEKIFLGGKITRGAGFFMPVLKEEALAHSFPELAKATEIHIATFGENAVVIGACAIAIRELLQSPRSALIETIQAPSMDRSGDDGLWYSNQLADDE